jgi:hypothetical protein
MSEFKTLSEWLGDATRGDGRKFTHKFWPEREWIEPIFKDQDNEWHGLDDTNVACVPCNDDLYKLFVPFVPEKKTKTVTMYQSIQRNSGGVYESGYLNESIEDCRGIKGSIGFTQREVQLYE